MKIHRISVFQNAINAASATLFCAVALSLDGQIYVASSAGGYVSEYDLSGVVINTDFITGLGYPWGMAWDGNGLLYVAQEGSRTVGKFTTSGTTINSSLISIQGDPEGVALDGEGHIFVVDGFYGTVGKYTTSGATINASLITGLVVGGFASIACDGKGHLFVANTASPKIAEYTTDGTLVNAAVITAPEVRAMTCDAHDHLFITSNGVIGDYTTSGEAVNASLITGGEARQFGIAVNAKGHLFISNFLRGTISEYSTDGTLINGALVSGLFQPLGIAAVAPPPIIACSSPVFLQCTNGAAIGILSASVQDTNGTSVEAIWSVDGTPYQTNTIPWSGGSLTESNLAFATSFSLGEHLVVVSASNGDAHSSCSIQVVVRDTLPPEIGSIAASPARLWPPNHRLVPVVITANAVDACDSAPTTRISKIISNQPESRFAPDWEITGTATANLRAERSGNSGDRVYTIFVEATDSSGNAETRTVNVTVAKSPRDDIKLAHGQ